MQRDPNISNGAANRWLADSREPCSMCGVTEGLEHKLMDLNISSPSEIESLIARCFHLCFSRAGRVLVAQVLNMISSDPRKPDYNWGTLRIYGY